VKRRADAVRGSIASARVHLVAARSELGRLQDASIVVYPFAPAQTTSDGQTDERARTPDIPGTASIPVSPSTVDRSDPPDGIDPGLADAESRVREREIELRGLERSERRFDRKAGHYRRVLRRQARRAAGIRRRIAASEHRLAGTEAALGSQIVAMTRLAQARAAKKTRRGLRRHGFAWPARGRLTQPYGCTGFALEPRRGSCAHFHDGIDIAGASGTPIRAAATGVVAYVGWNPWDHEGRAYIVVIGHAGGFVTRYGHLLPRSRVTVGRIVRRGQLIVYMGSTGNSTGPHLHLELLRGSTTVNPLAYL
jgi:murein DD-endopeptidase MepM/ murein hydrolase activator NlpD